MVGSSFPTKVWGEHLQMRRVWEDAVVFDQVGGTTSPHNPLSKGGDFVGKSPHPQLLQKGVEGWICPPYSIHE
jgi:hypothetical protein